MAAFIAISLRLSGVSFSARFFPPLAPSSCAGVFFLDFRRGSSSPVAALMALTADWVGLVGRTRFLERLGTSNPTLSAFSDGRTVHFKLIHCHFKMKGGGLSVSFDSIYAVALYGTSASYCRIHCYGFYGVPHKTW